MAKRPYNDPANIGENGQPKMSENAWEIYEQLREDMGEDSSWGIALMQKVESLESKVNGLMNMGQLIERISNIENMVSEMRSMAACLDQKASKSEVVTHANIVAVKIDALKSAVVALAAKLDSEDVTNLDTDYQDEVNALIA